MKTQIRTLLATALVAGSAVFVHAQAILISENFGGSSGDNLNGTTADTFSSAIVTAGGNATWRAPSDSAIRADGSITGSTNGAAYLNLGSYINDAMGTDTGLFTLTTSVAKPTTGGQWVSVGFYRDSADDNSLSGGNFTVAGMPGYATAIHRRGTDSSTNFFAGAQTNNGFDPGNLSTAVTFKIELDFTEAGGYNGVSNFGTVKFYSPSDLNTVSFSYTYLTAISLEGIGLGYGGTVVGSVDSFTLTQAAIPEPSTYAALIGAGVLGLAACRRRRVS